VKFRSAIYRQFGTYPEVTGILENRTETLDNLSAEIAKLLVQQRERILDLSEEVLAELLDGTCPEGTHAEDWDLDALRAGMKERFAFEPSINTKGLMERPKLADAMWQELDKVIEAREQELSLPFFLYFSRHFMLEEIDQRWIEHLRNMEALREGIHLRGYGQKDPKQEYKKEGFAIFGVMMVTSAATCAKSCSTSRSAAKRARARPRTWPSPRRSLARWSNRAAARPNRARRKRPKSPTPCAGPSPRSDATIPAPAAAARSTRSATGRSVRASRTPHLGRPLARPVESSADNHPIIVRSSAWRNRTYPLRSAHDQDLPRGASCGCHAGVQFGRTSRRGRDQGCDSS
jgi:preprotein translocase subunit SecA